MGRSPFSRASIDLDHWASSFNRARSKLENSTRASIIDSRVSIELDHPYLKILVHNCEWVNQVSCISHLWRIILNSGHLSLITVTNDLIFQYLYSQKLPYNLPNLKAWKAWKSLSIRHLELQSSSIKAWPTSIEFQSPSISHFGAQSIDRSIELKARPTSNSGIRMGSGIVTWMKYNQLPRIPGQNLFLYMRQLHPAVHVVFIIDDI